jgi:hypothetical protein
MSQYNYDVNSPRILAGASLAQSVIRFGFQPLNPTWFESHRWSRIFQYVLFRTLHFGEIFSKSRQGNKFVGKINPRPGNGLHSFSRKELTQLLES